MKLSDNLALIKLTNLEQELMTRIWFGHPGVVARNVRHQVSRAVRPAIREQASQVRDQIMAQLLGN